jgi:riboflavin kinase/FMN adenylyltransferase
MKRPMERIEVVPGTPAALRGASVALGNFDGVHAGHRAVLAVAADEARAQGAPLGLATFEPAPRRFFQPDAPPFRILSSLQRDAALAALDVEVCYVIRFDADLSRMSDEAFVRGLLVEAMGVSSVAIGFDFRFGKGRMGDAEGLTALGDRYGFSVRVVPEVQTSERKASSTAIREMLAAGDVGGAQAMLGRWWVVDGVVEPGEKRGRELGFPTANLRLGDLVQPAFGVYAVWARIEGESVWRPGVASFGRTPTTGLRDPLLEVVVFDFSGDLYGRRLDVAFAEWLRPEERFASLEDLVGQMHRDAAEAKHRLQTLLPPTS